MKNHEKLAYSYSFIVIHLILLVSAFIAETVCKGWSIVWLAVWMTSCCILLKVITFGLKLYIKKNGGDV